MEMPPGSVLQGELLDSEILVTQEISCIKSTEAWSNPYTHMRTLTHAHTHKEKENNKRILDLPCTGVLTSKKV